MIQQLTVARSGKSVWRRRLAAMSAAGAVALASAGAYAQNEAPEKGATPSAAPAPASGAERWIKVVEEKGGEVIKLELVSREYRLASGAGPSVFLTGAVHIADESFYKELQKFLDAKDVVLFEGVKPPGAGRLDQNIAQGDDESLVKATERRIRFVATFVEKFKRAHKAYPKSLDEIIKGADGRFSKILAGCTNDAWGHPLAYTLKKPDPVKQDEDKPKKGSDAFEITSLGADGKPAGDGVDADISFSDQPALKRGEVVQGEGLQRQLASAMRLKFQLDEMDDTKPNWRNTDLSVDQVMDRMDAVGADSEQLFSMIGGGSLMDVVVGGLARLVGMSTTLSTTFKMVMVDMLSQSDQLLGGMGGNMGKMMDVIIKDRNKVVIDDLSKVLRDEPNVKTIGIIYGAGHLPDMERRLTEELGFKAVGETWFTAITVNVADADMTAEQARETRQMIRSQIERQMKAMQKAD